jgi:hypothetical protein
VTGIVQALASIMDSVGAVRKADRNSSQNFNFRGIDAVVNAVSPALRHYGVVVTPELQSVEYGTVEIGKNRTAMGHVRVVVKYTFTAEDGSSLTATVPGEAMDSGDKATAKAMSVAFRTALLQALALPTDEPDPDSQSYERAPAQAKVMDEATYARALAAIQGAADEAAMTKIVDAFRGYAIKDEWEAALGEAVTDWHVARA